VPPVLVQLKEDAVPHLDPEVLVPDLTPVPVDREVGEAFHVVSVDALRVQHTKAGSATQHKNSYGKDRRGEVSEFSEK